MQGYFGKFSHYEGHGSEYAIDFGMPEGTVICAARPGVVVAVRGDSKVGGPKAIYRSAANYVVIKHADGTYGRYVHLLHGSPMVALGQEVVIGQPLGKVGSTGFTSAPHLHFEVMVPIDGRTAQTIPTLFRKADGKGISLLQGQTVIVY